MQVGVELNNREVGCTAEIDSIERELSEDSNAIGAAKAASFDLSSGSPDRIITATTVTFTRLSNEKTL